MKRANRRVPRRNRLLLSGCALWITGCPGDAPTGRGSQDQNQNQSPNGNGGEPIRNPELAAVNDYAYQLQGDPELDLTAIGQTAFDLVIIDYSRDGGEEGGFTQGEIVALKNSSGGAKIVLGYMSIGEAEIGRFYFDNAWISPDPDTNPDGPFTLTAQAPAFLAPPNPNFPDNFKVRYWEPDWQSLIVHNPGGHPVLGDARSYLDRIIDAGFDGVYLDIIDAFEFFGPSEVYEGATNERRTAARDMIDFVRAIADYARDTRGAAGFIVIPQNGSGIIDPTAYPTDTLSAGQSPETFAREQKERYFAGIDGLGAEDTFYFGDADEDNPCDPQTATIEHLREFRRAGLPILAIDYVTTTAAIDDFYTRANDEGWVPYASVRALDRLTVNPTQPPD